MYLADERAPANLRGGCYSSHNPATGEVVGEVVTHSVAEVHRAVLRARAAQHDWGNTSTRERAKTIRRLRDSIVDNAGHIARVDHEETGKLETEAKGLILPVLDACGYYASLAETLERGSNVSSGLLVGRTCHVAYRPAGVVAVISPWNFPFFLAMMQIIPALLAGNAVLHKPSEHTARVGLLIEALCARAGVPKDVMQVVIGDGTVGSAIIDAGVDVISFTGGTPTGRKVMQAAAKNLTPVVLELGGKDAAIVCDDADLDRAANGITWGAFINAGQTCVATKRAIVASRVYERFVAELAFRAKELTTRRHDLSPLTLPGELARLEQQIEASLAMGAKLVAGGRRIPGPGFYYEPTVLAGCHPTMPAVCEESFGPLLTVLEAKNDDHAIALANDSEFGLSASVWTRELERGSDIARRLHTGSVAVNDVLSPATNPRLPFGGAKHSGVGRSFSEMGYLNFCNVQSVVIARFPRRSDPHWFPYPRNASGLLDRAIGLYHGSLLEKMRRVLR